MAIANTRTGSWAAGIAPRSDIPGARLRGIQVALGVMWLVDGLLQFQPYMFSRAFLQSLASTAQGQPGIVQATILIPTQIAMPYRGLFDACFALVQVTIGLGLIVSPRTVRPALVLSFGWSVVVWWVGEGLGMLFTGTASPLTGAPGAVLLYAVIGLLVWPAPQVQGADQSSVAVRDLAGRVAWALLWLLLGGLMLLPLNSAPNATRDAFDAAAASPGTGPLAALDSAMAALTAGRGLLVSVISAGVMVAVGVMVLIDWHRNLALAAGAVIGAFYFVTLQFLGGMLTGQGTDPNTGPLFVLFAALLWVGPLPAPSRLHLVQGWLAAPRRPIHHPSIGLPAGGSLRERIGEASRSGRDSRQVLEDVARLGAATLLRNALEAQVNELLGRERYAGGEPVAEADDQGTLPIMIDAPDGPMTMEEYLRRHPAAADRLHWQIDATTIRLHPPIQDWAD